MSTVCLFPFRLVKLLFFSESNFRFTHYVVPGKPAVFFFKPSRFHKSCLKIHDGDQNFNRQIKCIDYFSFFSFFCWLAEKCHSRSSLHRENCNISPKFVFFFLVFVCARVKCVRVESGQCEGQLTF